MDLVRGAQRADTFLELSPMGQVPVLEHDGQVVFDSHAIMIYLAEHYGPDQWWPNVPSARAQILSWMFFDANELHNSIGYARNILSFGAPGSLPAAQDRARKALNALQVWLSSREWLVLERMTLADLACAPLLAVANEAGVNVSDFPRVAAWLARVLATPGYPAMPRRP